MKVGEYRKIAREKLAGQWGINAGITLLSFILTAVISQLAESVVNGDTTRSLISNGLEIFVLFAFSYGLYYIALHVLRGGKAQVSQLFNVFQKEYYLPMLGLNLLNMLAQVIIGILVFIPLLIQGGFALYASLVVGRGASVSSSNTLLEHFSSGSFILLSALLLLVFLFLALVISGLFDFAIWLKFDHPEMKMSDCLKKAWFLIKDRLGKYVLLQLSFVGWLILGAMALLIGLLFVAPYINVSNAAFYEQALKEKAPELAEI